MDFYNLSPNLEAYIERMRAAGHRELYRQHGFILDRTKLVPTYEPVVCYHCGQSKPKFAVSCYCPDNLLHSLIYDGR